MHLVAKSFEKNVVGEFPIVLSKSGSAGFSVN